MVERYLCGRGITGRPLPPCLRYRANAYGRHAAMVALATTDAGEVAAVQQVYLTDDGAKAPIPVPKRTNKARDDWAERAAVRLPGKPPLILCEGVETALSLWQATGQEVWACLGVANIGKAPVPTEAERHRRPRRRLVRQPGRPAAPQCGHRAAASRPLGPSGRAARRHGLQRSAAATTARVRSRPLLEAAGDGSSYSTAWRAGLLCNEEGYPRALLANAIHALREAPEWQGVLWHNELATTTEARRAPPWAAALQPWTDTPWSDREDTLDRRLAAAPGHRGLGHGGRPGRRGRGARSAVPSPARVSGGAGLGRGRAHRELGA